MLYHYFINKMLNVFSSTGSKARPAPQADGIIGEVLQEKSGRRLERAEGVGGGGK